MIGLVFLAMAALAPKPGPEGKLERIVLDAINKCGAAAKPGEIAVCGRRIGTDVYRGSDALRQVERMEADEDRQRVRQRLVDDGPGAVGRAGTGSCTAVGAGGWTGCRP